MKKTKAKNPERQKPTAEIAATAQSNDLEIRFLNGIQEVSGSIPLISTIDETGDLRISGLFVFRKPLILQVTESSPC